MTPDHCPTIIRLSDVDMRYDRNPVLSDINLDIHRNDFIAITGPNGGGKTTLLRIILRLLRPTSGKVEYLAPDGSPVERLPIGYLPQKNMIDSRFPVTVREVISSGLLAVKGLDSQQVAAKVDKMLTVTDLHSHADSTIGSLSGGQLQRALLGRALVSDPSILVLDEPLSYIDKRFEAQLYELIAGLAPSTTILLVSHEMSVFAEIANRHLIIDYSLHECTAKHHFTPSPCN